MSEFVNTCIKFLKRVKFRRDAEGRLGTHLTLGTSSMGRAATHIVSIVPTEYQMEVGQVVDNMIFAAGASRSSISG